MTDYQDLSAGEASRTAGASAVAGPPAWLDPIRDAADKAYCANPGGPLRPEVVARIRRTLLPAAPAPQAAPPSVP